MTRDEYLAQVAARLPLPEPQRAEVLEELAAHLGDGVADLVAKGRDREGAEAEVLRRLGSSDDLARGLLRARQTRSQLLAAAGAGVVAALRTGLFGAVAGWLLVALASVLATVVLQSLQPLLGLPSWSGWTPGWNSVITGLGLAIGAALAGAAAVRVVAARSWRCADDVRAAVAIAGGVILGWWVLVLSHESLNWASVLAYLAIPVAFIAGARFEKLGPPSARTLVIGTAALLLAGLVVGTAGGFASRSGPEGGYSWDAQSHGYSMIAPWWQVPGSANADIIASDSGWGGLGVDQITVEATSASVIGKFTDFRFEAWKTQPPQDNWALLPGQTGPFAVAPATPDGSTVSGTITFNQAPGVDWAQVVLTAIGPDGRRYLLWAEPSPQQTEFNGSVWSWFAAIAR